jgi:hypothetical protein
MILGYLGADIRSILNEEALKGSWDNLYQSCTWATVFQERRYVHGWYDLYNTVYTPLLIIEKNNDQITSIFPLAITSNSEIVGAGYSQAEYHCWLTTKENSKTFFSEAVQWMRQEFPDKRIHLQYLPHLTPIEDLQNDPFLKPISIWKAHPQGVMKINEEWLNIELQKKKRREEINRLKRLGDLKFLKVEKIEEFRSILDDLIIQYDFRQMAIW